MNKYLIVLLVGISITSKAQNNICNVLSMDNYTIDGQSYTLTFDEKPQVSVYLVFFSGFDYRLHFCSPNIKKYHICLYDIEKKVLFSDLCQNHELNLDFRFESNLAAIIEISQRVESDSKIMPGEIRLTVGFKENKQGQFK